MPPSPPSSSGIKGSVLLVEGYGALAAAIRAALKKFAPLYVVSRARSLSAALTAARGKPPALLILDFDPPFPGILDFFSLLREIAPAARVMVIAANLPRQILGDERLPTVFSFVEKPFQLAEFGTAITDLLSTSDPANESSARTALEAMSLVDLIPILGIESITGTVGVTAAEGALVGELVFDRGSIPIAAASGLQGIDALREMLRWPAPEFDFTEGGSDAPRQIEGKWPRILETVVRSIPRPAPTRSAAKKAGKKSATRDQPHAAVVKDGKKILIIDDTETLRVFIEEILSESDPRLQIACAADAAEGMKRCAALNPDLILLDFSLPDFNGNEVCRRLLDNDATREIPVLMMSGHVADMAEAERLYENIVLTLSKPFVSGELLEAVTKLLEKPPERRRRKAPPAAAKPDRRSTKTDHETNGHAPKPVPVPAAQIEIPAAPEAESILTAPTSPELTPETPAPEAESILSPAPHIPAHIAVASRDAVVLSIDLEVLSMQFSPALHITHLRAQPTSPAVLLHVDPRAISAMPIPQIAFEISRVQLGDAGQMHTLFIVPAVHRPPPQAFHKGVPVDRLAILPGDEQNGLQITPAATSHLTVRLLAAFDLAGVELSPTFSVSLLVLRARSGRMRVVLPAHGSRGGIIFEATQISLDPTGRIAEFDLHVAPLLAATAISLLPA
ncbi:MAG: response regulator [Chthoniobacterales bacterium]